MMFQRLDSKRTLSSAVQWLSRHSATWPVLDRCRRVRDGKISVRTGGYCQARQKLPTLVANRVRDHLFENLQQQMRQTLADVPRPVFVVDGTTLRMPVGKELAAAYPPGRNQHGENHWPTMILLAFHDAHTGLAARPSWGAMYGEDAVSEQQLADEALQRLPADALVMGDANFGTFAFVHAVHQTQRPLLLRLTASRAGKVLGERKLRPGRRCKIVWQPSAFELKKYPGLGERPSVTGWVAACRNPARKEEILYFFTTLDLKPARLLALYKLRWNIETDLRSLKRTVNLHQLTSKTPAMVEKELLMAMAAYNLVRAAMYLAARQAGLSPRQLSFSSSQDAVIAAWPDLLRAQAAGDAQPALARLLAMLVQTKLPVRTRKRSYPRRIWGRGGRFPFHRSAPVPGARP
jgi:putative transposase